MTPNERTCCAGTARWLSASASAVGSVGLLAAGSAVLLLVMRQPLPELASAALLLLLVERVYVLRLKFDAGLFADLAHGECNLPALDQALQVLRLRSPGAVPRPLSDRIKGARRLALRHGLVATLQFAAVATQALLLGWGWTR